MTDTKDQIDAAAILKTLRKSIDNLDAALILLLAERFKLTMSVGQLKKQHHLPPGDAAREEAMIARLRHMATEAELDPDFAEKFIRFVIREVIHHHERIKQTDG